MKKSKFIIGSLLALLVLLPFFSSQLIYKERDPVQLHIPCINNDTLCSGSATCNITIIYPNSSVLIENQEMNNNNGFFTYELLPSQTTPTGYYQTTIVCKDNDNNGYSTFEYEITVNGKEKPDGVIVVTFVILFLIIVAVLIGLILYTAGKFIEEDFNLWDLIYNVSSYFVIFAIYIFGKEYLANSFVNSFLVWVISITAITNILFPLIVFILSITLWKIKERDKWKF